MVLRMGSNPKWMAISWVHPRERGALQGGPRSADFPTKSHPSLQALGESARGTGHARWAQGAKETGSQEGRHRKDGAIGSLLTHDQVELWQHSGKKRREAKGASKGHGA